MIRLLTSIMLLWLAASASGANIVIEGTVRLATPKAPAAKARYQGQLAGLLPPDPPTAIVYLEGSFPGINSTNRPQIAQQGFQFRPRLLAVQAGSRVEFPNLDPDYHSVFSYSKTREFDLGRYRREESPPAVVFDKPGVVSVGCEIHDHMRATLLVLETPWFTTTDEQGRFRLEIDRPIPPGTYKLKAWLDERRIRELTIELKEGSPIRAEFPEK